MRAKPQNPPKRTRWLSIPDVVDQVLKRSNGFADRIRSRSRKTQVQAVRRLVVRAEQRDEERFTKRIGHEIYVKAESLEALLPDEHETVTRLEGKVEDHAHVIRQIREHQIGHGTKLRDHDKRLVKVEKKQELFAKFQAELVAIDSGS